MVLALRLGVFALVLSLGAVLGCAEVDKAHPPSTSSNPKMAQSPAPRVASASELLLPKAEHEGPELPPYMKGGTVRVCKPRPARPAWRQSLAGAVRALGVDDATKVAVYQALPPSLSAFLQR